MLGGGPAGRALAGECAAHGMRTTLVDPTPDRPWRATYGAWIDELPDDLPAAVIGARADAWAFGTGPHRLGRCYAVLDTGALRAHLDERLAGVRVVAARARAVRDQHSAHAVHLADGGELTADVVVDATGAPGSPRQAPRRVAEQTAYGVIVPAAEATPLVDPGAAVIMDWRPDHGRDGWPTFLYAVPYGDGTVLLEETSLARRPGLGLPELRARLHARLHRHGVEPDRNAPVERVRFPVDSPRAPASPVRFGAATPLVHPASGFSVATALTLAPDVAAALRDGLDTSGRCGAAAVDDLGDLGGSGDLGPSRRTSGRGRPGSVGPTRRASGRGCPPDRAVAAARNVLWSPRARAVHRLRRLGLQTVLDLPPALVPSFFDAFFRLPPEYAMAFLSGRDDPVGTLRAMAALFQHATPAVRTRLLRSAVWPAAVAARRTTE